MSQVKCAKSCMRVGQRVSSVRAVEVPVSVCLRSSCSHVTEAGGPWRFVRIGADGFHVKWPGLCGCNPAVPLTRYLYATLDGTGISCNSGPSCRCRAQQMAGKGWQLCVETVKGWSPLLYRVTSTERTKSALPLAPWNRILITKMASLQGIPYFKEH